MATTYVPPDHHLARYVAWARLRKDEDDNVVGVLSEAFELRSGEDYLSATWVEHFPGTRTQSIEAAVKAIRSSKMKVGTKSGFALGKVADIRDTCNSFGKKVRFVHEREEDNCAHVALCGWPSEGDELFERLAADTWSELVLNKDIP